MSADHTALDGRRARVCRSVSAWLLIVLTCGVASAQESVEIVFSSQPSPVGAGARATGVGSAFIAVADDATAASWNPGGLTQLDRPEMSVVARGIAQFDELGDGTRTFDTGESTSAAGQSDSFATGSLNYLSVAIPFSVIGRNLVAALNYQQVLSFERDLHFRFDNDSPGFHSFTNAHLVQAGGVDAVTPALAFTVAPGLSLGAAFNYWIDGLGHDFAWRETFEQSGAFEVEGFTQPTSGSFQDTFQHFRGANGTIGLLWDVTDEVALGAVWKTPFTAHVHHVARSPSDPSFPVQRQRHRMQLPASYGIGARWRPSDQLTLSTDVTWVDWAHFRTVSSTGEEFLVTGDLASTDTVDGVFTERVGAEYVWLLPEAKLTARTGLFFDPEPSRGAPRPFYGGSLGFGVTLASVSVDLAYQVRAGLAAKHTSVATQLVDLPSVELDTVQNLFYLSIVEYL